MTGEPACVGKGSQHGLVGGVYSVLPPFYSSLLVSRETEWHHEFI